MMGISDLLLGRLSFVLPELGRGKEMTLENDVRRRRFAIAKEVVYSSVYVGMK